MRIESGHMVALGYGKYFRSDYIIGLEPIEEGRGPGRRTHVYVANLSQPFVASRSETVILRDMTQTSDEMMRVLEQNHLLEEILDTVQGINPLMRNIVREQGSWDLDKLESRIQDVLGDDG